MRANRAHTRSRTGCLTCRRRRKKCDERKPKCANCERNNLECAGYQAPVKWTAATTPGKKRACGPGPAGTDTERQNNPPTTTMTASPGLIGGVPPRCSSLPSSPQLPFLINGIRTADDKRLLHHFTHTLSPKLVLHPEPAKNPFNKTVLPMALHDEQDWGLFDLMLSFAASHLVRILLKESGQRPTDETRHLENIKWIRYGHGIMRHAKNLSSILDHGKKKKKSLEGNNTEPSDDDDDTEINYALATTMLLCQWCTCEGGDQSPWRLHLNASRELVRRKVESRRGSILEPLSDASQMLLEWFFFHNVISMVTFPRPSFNIDLQNSRTAAETVGNDFSASSDTLPRIFNRRPISEILWIGPNDGLLEILERILALRHHELPPGESGNGNDFDVKQFFEVLAIEDALREWSFNYINSQQLAVGASYQCAAYIMLYFTLYNRTSSASNDPNVRSWVSSLMQHLAAISDTDNAQTCALFPLFICGVTVSNPRDRHFVIGKVQAYSRWSGMGYIEDVAGFLMDWWREQDRMDAARTCGNEEGIDQSTPSSSWWAWEYFMRQRGLQLILI